MGGKHWTPNEEKGFKELYLKELAVPEIAAKLGRSEQACYHKARDLGIHRTVYKSGGNYSKKITNLVEDVDWKIYFLKRTTNLSNREIAERLGLTKGQVQRRAFTRGLHMHEPGGEPPEWFKEAMDKI